MEAKKNNSDESLMLIAKSSIIVLVAVIISKVLTLLFRIVITKTGPENYGLFSLSSFIVECIVAIFSFGLAAGLLRYVSIFIGGEEQLKIRHVTKTSLRIVTLSGILGGSLLFILSEFISTNIFHDPNLIIFLRWFSIAVPVYVLAAMFINIMQAFEKVQWISFLRNILFNVVELALILILFIIFLKTNKSLYPYAIIFSYIIAGLVLLFSSYIYCRIKLPDIFKKSNFDKITRKQIDKELLTYSWPLMFIGIINFVFLWSDSFLIGIFKDSSAVGIYNVAVPIAFLLTVASGLFYVLFMPLITKEYARKDFESIKDTSKQIGKWIFMLNLPIFVIMLLFPGTIINILFGSDYLAGEWSLRFLSIGLLSYSIFIISENLLSMVGKSKIVLSNMIIASIINIILNYILIQQPHILMLNNSNGLVGASIATMLTYIIWSIISMLQARKYTSIIPIRKKMINITLSILIPTIYLVIIKRIVPISIFTLGLIGISFVLLYILMLFITRSFDEKDNMIITAIKNKIGHSVKLKNPNKQDF